MARVSADQAADKWASRLSGSTAEIAAGVQGVTVAPGQSAAKAADKWLANVQAAKAKFATNVGRVSLSEWQDKMVNVGIPRIASGANANKGKVQAFQAAFLPHLDAGVAKVKAMPNLTLEDSINRAAAMIRHNATFKR